MPDLTDEEYDALGEYYTKNPLKVDPAKKAVFLPIGGNYLMCRIGIPGISMPHSSLMARMSSIAFSQGLSFQAP
jgi:hypothetical protein